MTAVVQRRFPSPGRLPLAAAVLALAALNCLRAEAADRASRHPLIGKPAPELAGHMFAGPSHNFRLSERQGEVVVIGFWTSWCGSCRAYLERLGKLNGTYASAGLVVVGVSLDDKPDAAAGLARAVNVRFGNLFDAEKVLGRRFAVADVPLTMLVDRGGVVRYVHGELDAAGDAALLRELRELLDE